MKERVKTLTRAERVIFLITACKKINRKENCKPTQQK